MTTAWTLLRPQNCNCYNIDIFPLVLYEISDPLGVTDFNSWMYCTSIIISLAFCLIPMFIFIYFIRISRSFSTRCVHFSFQCNIRSKFLYDPWWTFRFLHRCECMWISCWLDCILSSRLTVYTKTESSSNSHARFSRLSSEIAQRTTDLWSVTAEADVSAVSDRRSCSQPNSCRVHWTLLAVSAVVGAAK